MTPFFACTPCWNTNQAKSWFHWKISWLRPANEEPWNAEGIWPLAVQNSWVKKDLECWRWHWFTTNRSLIPCWSWVPNCHPASLKNGPQFCTNCFLQKQNPTFWQRLRSFWTKLDLTCWKLLMPTETLLYICSLRESAKWAQLLQSWWNLPLWIRWRIYWPLELMSMQSTVSETRLCTHCWCVREGRYMEAKEIHRSFSPVHNACKYIFQSNPAWEIILKWSPEMICSTKLSERKSSLISCILTFCLLFI